MANRHSVLFFWICESTLKLGAHSFLFRSVPVSVAPPQTHCHTHKQADSQAAALQRLLQQRPGMAFGCAATRVFHHLRRIQPVCGCPFPHLLRASLWLWALGCKTLSAWWPCIDWGGFTHLGWGLSYLKDTWKCPRSCRMRLPLASLREIQGAAPSPAEVAAVLLEMPFPCHWWKQHFRVIIFSYLTDFWISVKRTHLQRMNLHGMADLKCSGTRWGENLRSRKMIQWTDHPVNASSHLAREGFPLVYIRSVKCKRVPAAAGSALPRASGTLCSAAVHRGVLMNSPQLPLVDFSLELLSAHPRPGFTNPAES